MLIQDGKPIAYASRAMTMAQLNYAVIEKELLAVLFGCERFHQYIYGKKVHVESDHKPLESIMKKPLSNAPPRLQRMLLRLQKYDIHLTHKAGKWMILADTLSRAHVMDMDEKLPEEDGIAQIHMIYANCAATDEKLETIKQETCLDLHLKTLLWYINNGWPRNKEDVSEVLRVYWSYKEDLSVINGIIFKGERIVIPMKMRTDILKKLHQSHMGIEKTKLRARETVFWPGINRQIEDMVKACETCLTNRSQQRREPLIPSEIADYPFQMVGTDLFYWNGQDFLLTVDYYSRYWEIERLYETQSVNIIKKLKMMFSRHGIPQMVRSDNGPQFISTEFKKFAKLQELFKRFEDYCLPKRNLVVERRQFFQRNQHKDESCDAYVTELKNLSSTCEFETINEGMILYKIVDGIRSSRVRDVLLRKVTDLTLEKAINICRTDAGLRNH